MEEVIEAAFRNDGAVAGIVVVDQQSRRRGEQADGGQGSGNVKVLPCVEDFDLLGYRYRRNGTGEVGVERTLKRGSKMPIIFGQRCGY